jgi:hypothetical protein
MVFFPSNYQHIFHYFSPNKTMITYLIIWCNGGFLNKHLMALMCIPTISLFVRIVNQMKIPIGKIFHFDQSIGAHKLLLKLVIILVLKQFYYWNILVSNHTWSFHLIWFLQDFSIFSFIFNMAMFVQELKFVLYKYSKIPLWCGLLPCLCAFLISLGNVL